MAHFAKIGMNGKVIQVCVVDNYNMKNADNVEDESVGQQYLESTSNWPAAMWIQTSYNTRNNTHSSGNNSKALRGNYASIGYIWDEDNNIFWPPKPFPSWVKNTTTAEWNSPKGAAPDLTAEQTSQNEALSHFWRYNWNESNQSWDIVDDKA